ncbi:GH39 family glycosyl hydrolase [Pelagicoccus mobilis]|uniref:Glycosyl hydrolases family 39 N-terminal catalytic domain-containing protein n=1 Tax=Pelagicoccus mobilis TaxID=415221 RepID=A0A934VTU2_9BACT|nr:hypothetical protein [Pelagicoccus mobilis]MBK1880430.1 hypothetical protein [Pelagicoccus mobilis]
MKLKIYRYFVASFLLASGCLASVHEQNQFTVNTDAVSGGIDNLWNVRVYTGPAASNPKQIKRFAERKIDYLNNVRLLGGRNDNKNDWFKGVDDNGNAICEFGPAIKHLQAVLDIGLTPWIVLDNVPWGMVKDAEVNAYGQCHPADDINVWYSYVQQFVQELVNEFGEETVSQWRFRVGTEPDLFPKHWASTKEEYLKHYDYTVAAVESVIPEPVIGPGNILMYRGSQVTEAKGGRWGLEILEHCARGTNYYTGKIGTRVSFFGFSYYYLKDETDGFHFERHWKRIKESLDQYPKFADVGLEIQEYGVLTTKKTKEQPLATEWFAGYYAHTADLAYRYGGKKIFNWTQDYEGIPHPWTQVRDALAEMEGGIRFEVERETDNELFSGVIPAWKDGSLYLVVYSHAYDDMMGNENLNEITLKVTGQKLAPNSTWSVTEQQLDRDHGTYIPELYNDLKRAGIQPMEDAPTYTAWARQRYGTDNQNDIKKVISKNRDKYLQLAKPAVVRSGEEVRTSADGSLTLDLKLKGSSVRFLKLTPAKTAE